MPEYLAPGVYVEEVAITRGAIQAVPTDVVGMVGVTARGPVAPTAVRSVSEFERLFGAVPGESWLGAAVDGFFQNGGRHCMIARVAADSRPPSLADYLGTSTSGPPTALAALEAHDDVALLAVPDAVRTAPVDLWPLNAALVAQCERRRDRVALLSVPAGARDPARLPRLPDSAFAAAYAPWVVADGADGPVCVPPVGHVAGVIARVDAARGVHKAPANEAVYGIDGLEFAVSVPLQERLQQRHVNTLRDLRPSGRGIRVWGARTLSSDPLWKYVNVRRLLLTIQQSIVRGTRWAVFEPNGEALWSAVCEQIEAFLHGLWRTGALLGNRPQDSYQVRCDRTTMTSSDLDRGHLVCQIGVAPLRPAEFVIFRVGQKTADAQV